MLRLVALPFSAPHALKERKILFIRLRIKSELSVWSYLICVNGPRWLNTEFVGLDANFKLKQFKVSSIARDPSLNDGRAYMVEDEKYSKFLSEFQNAESEPKVFY